jgi:hypothetical protein
MPFEPDFCRVEPDSRVPGIFWMFEPGESRPFGHLEATVLPTRWRVKVVLARDDLGPDEILPLVARALVVAMDCKAEVVEVLLAKNETTHTLVNVGSRFV